MSLIRRKVFKVPTFNAATGKVELCEWIVSSYAVERVEVADKEPRR